MAQELKAKGNELFKQGDFTGAEDFYSQAITKNPTDPTFFSNRALVRIKLEKWPGVEHDARTAVSLYAPVHPASLKSSWYLAQALLALQRPQEAHKIAVDAYERSLETQNSQTENLSRTVLLAKQQLWKARETARLRDLDETLKSVEVLIESQLQKEVEELQRQLDDGVIGAVGFGEDSSALREDAEKKIGDLREAFRIASKGEVQERVVPDYLIDGITFEIMHDPWITPSGSSFDRIGIFKYVEKSGVDPLTRTPMTVKDLRPNYALKAACEEFLTKNGWAVDW